MEKKEVPVALNQKVEAPRKAWVSPDLHMLDAADAENNPGAGADLNGRLS